MSKTSNFVTKEFDTIIKDSREYRAYELGVASGCFNLYSYIKKAEGVENAKKAFEHIFDGSDRTSEYFRKLIELDEEPLTEKEKLIFEFQEKHEKYRATCK